MKIIKNENGVYCVKYVAANGKTITRSLKTKSQKEAKLLAKESKIEELEMAAKIKALTKDTLTSILSGKVKTIEDVSIEYNKFRKLKSHSEHSIYSEESILGMFFRDYKLEGKSVADINTEDIHDYANRDDKSSLAHRNKKLTSIRGYLSYAIANAYILKDPSYGVTVDKSKLPHAQKEKKQGKAFTKKEYESIRRKTSYFWSVASDFAWWTGLRLSDIARMEWDSFDADHLIIHTLKTDTRVALPYDDPLIGGGILRDTIARIDPDDEVFCFPNQAWLARTASRRATLSTYFARELQRKLPGVHEEGKTFHSFRRAFVTRCKREGKQLEDIAAWVGHSSTDTTKIYDVS